MYKFSVRLWPISRENFYDDCSIKLNDFSMIEKLLSLIKWSSFLEQSAFGTW